MSTMTLVLSILVGVLAAVLLPLYPLMKKKAESTETKVDDVILDIALKGVEYANSYFNGSSNETKKTMATVKALEELSKVGIKSVSDKTLGVALETAVMKTKEKAVDEAKKTQAGE